MIVLFDVANSYYFLSPFSAPSYHIITTTIIIIIIIIIIAIVLPLLLQPFVDLHDKG